MNPESTRSGNAGGKNFSIRPDELSAFLNLVTKSPLNEMTALSAASLHRGRIARAIGFQSERHLEDCIVEAVTRGLRAEDRVHRQRSFRSSHFANGRDKPDFIIETPEQAIVCELKLYRAIEPDVVQLARYVANTELNVASPGRCVCGALITFEFEAPIRRLAAAEGFSLYSYSEGTGLPLHLVQGPDVLAPFLAV